MMLDDRDIAHSKLGPRRGQSAWSGRQSLTSLSRPVALSLPLVLLLGPLSIFSFADLSVNEILTKVSETYRGLQSYQLVADVSEEVASVGDIRSTDGTSRTTSNFHQSTNSEVELAAVSPGKVRLLSRNDTREVLLISDGNTTWTYLPKKKQYTEVLSITPVTNQPRNDGKAETDFLRQNQELLVNRYRGISKFSSNFALEKDNQIKVGKEKVDCFVLKMETPNAVHEIWVDKNSFIVWRSKDSNPAAQDGITLKRTTTVNLKSANLNMKLEDSFFVFTPPEKAAKVQSLNNIE